MLSYYFVSAVSVCFFSLFLRRLLMSLGVIWILFSLVASVGRAYTLHLVERHTKIQWLSSTSRYSSILPC